VIAAPNVIAAHVARAREGVSDAFRRIFDGELVQAHRQLALEPADLPAKVRFITLYHDYRSGEGLLPGFVECYSKIHHDETPHIGYGVWFLRETVWSEPQMGEVVRQTLGDLLPSVAALLAPPDAGTDRDFAAIGASSDDIRAFALGGLTTRLDIIGAPLVASG